MLFEQYQPQDLLTPSVNDGGLGKLNSSLTSLDFYLLDDIDAYLSPPFQSKPNKNDLDNDSINTNSQYQGEEDEFLANFDFSDLNNLEEKSGLIDELDLEKWISEVSFPSPPMDTSNSPLSTLEDTSSTVSWFDDQYPKSADMVVPPSPPLSSAGSSPQPPGKKTKLSVVERKLRKKGQNKTAAEKYRIKKKSERNQLLDRHAKLRTINKELKLEFENLSYRVQQLKQLFNDFVQTN